MKWIFCLIPLFLFGNTTELSSEKISWQGSSLFLEKVFYSGSFFEKSLSISGDKALCLFSSEKTFKDFSLSLENRIECLLDNKYRLSCGKMTYTPQQTIFGYPTPKNPCLLSYENQTLNTSCIKINQKEASLEKPFGNIPLPGFAPLLFSSDELSLSLDTRSLILKGNVVFECPNTFLLKGEKISCLQNDKIIQKVISEGKTEIINQSPFYQICCLGTIEVIPSTKEILAIGVDPLILETQEATIYANEAHVSYGEDKTALKISLEKDIRFFTKDHSCLGMADTLTFFPDQNLYILACHGNKKVLLQQKDKGSLTASVLRIQRKKGNDLISAEGIVHVSFTEEEDKLFQELFTKFVKLR
ncbi:MAG: hypothetical protein WCP39_04915 [Chlamydiota bacterium]